MPNNNKNAKRDKIIVRGARVNNLKNIDIDVPRDKLVVVTGLSGSGKSTLAFDTIFAEGNRRYLESMSSFASQFLDVSSKPDVDKIENLSPTISIDQKSVARSPRSTVGTLTEIYDYLRVLFTQIGEPFCPDCGKVMKKKTNQEILDELLTFPSKTQLAILAKIEKEGKTNRETLKSISQLGYARVRINGKIILTSDAILTASDQIDSSIEVVVDRITLEKKNPDKERIVDSIETAIKLGKGSMIVSVDNDKDLHFNNNFICNECDFRIEEVSPQNFSFNNPKGACSRCSGLGYIQEIDENLVIPNKKLSLAEGAIMPWSKSGGRSGGQNQYMDSIKLLGKKYGFSVNVPVGKISPSGLKAILYGEKEMDLDDDKTLDAAKRSRENFKGVIPILGEKYKKASSDYMRSDIEKYMNEKVCPDCQGKRLKKEYRSFLIDEKSIDQVSDMDMENFQDFLSELEKKQEKNKEAVRVIVQEMKMRSQALCDVGLEYLSLSRSADSISGGEGQRIRLATQIGSDLMGIMYILDEPTVGLHNRDTEKLIKTLRSLRDAGNSLIVVEHDRAVINSADWVIDMGPGAGEEGGEVIFEGEVKKLLQTNDSTAQYLVGKKTVAWKKSRRKGNGKSIEIIGASEHNLKNIDVSIPLGKLVSITGVSGSGKSTLVNDILAKALSKHFFKAKKNPGKHEKIKGLSSIDKVISIDQSPIGRTPRSNAATYTGVFSLIRDLFSKTEEAKKRNYTASRFSFNMKGGRCEVCQGEGHKKIEMYLLPDMQVKCEVCQGTRYNRNTLEIEYQGVNIAQVLDMSVSYALQFFKKHPLIVDKLKTLEEVGLGYLKLGQSATSLSGGEAQRIKLATELSRRETGKTLYILDEPTIGLHFDDVKKLLAVLDALVEKGNSVLIVEHSPDVINNSDWIIDLGPEGGKGGGKIVFEGTPEKLKKCKKSWTGKYL